MKKLVIFLTIFFSSIFFINNIKAVSTYNGTIDNNIIPSFDKEKIKITNTINLTEEEMQQRGVSDTTIIVFKELRKKAQEEIQAGNYNKYIIIRGQSSVSDSSTGIYYAIYDLLLYNEEDLIYNYISMFYRDNNSSLKEILTGIGFNRANIKGYSYDYVQYKNKKTPTSKTAWSWNWSDANTKTYLRAYNSGRPFDTTIKNQENLATSNFTMIYESELPIKYNANFGAKMVSTTQYKIANTININDNEKLLSYVYTTGETIADSTGKVAFEKNTYKINDYFEDIKDIAKIEYTFDIPKQKDFEFNMLLLAIYNNPNLPKAYIESKNNKLDITTKQNEIFEIDQYFELDEKGDKIWQVDKNDNPYWALSGEVGLSYLPTDSLKLIFDTNGIDGELKIQAEINFSYTKNIITNEQYNEELITIDMQNKYGLYLWPKTYNQDNITNVITNGIYNIELRTNFKSNEDFESEILYENYNQNIFSFRFQGGEDHQKELLYFENTKFGIDDKNFKISFNKNEYNYAIRENFFDEVIITNPNNGEQVNMGTEDGIGGKKKIESPKDILEYIKTIFNGNKVVFGNIKEIYNKIRETKIGIYIFVVIIISLVIWLIKVARK